MRAARDVTDSPWRRMFWSLPLALLLVVVGIAGFATLFGRPPSPVQGPQPLAMQIVELPPAAAAPAKAVLPALPPPPSEPEVPPAEPSMPPVVPPPPPPPPKPVEPETVPATPPPPLQPRKPKIVHKPAKPRPAPSQPPHAAEPAPLTPVSPPQAAPPASPANSAPGGATMGARALYKPMPEIPDELRRRPVSIVAVARFHVAPDGSVMVELLQATPDPTFNTALIASLRQWRFFPAMTAGRPVASTIDIRVPVVVQ